MLNEGLLSRGYISVVVLRTVGAFGPLGHKSLVLCDSAAWASEPQGSHQGGSCQDELNPEA